MVGIFDGVDILGEATSNAQFQFHLDLVRYRSASPETIEDGWWCVPRYVTTPAEG